MQFSRNGFNRILSTGFLLVSSFFAYDALGADSVKGTAIYRERIKLPPGAVFEATLEDVSRADAPAEQMGRVYIENPGSPPFHFEISYDPARITANHRYSVRARITVKERLLFNTDRAYRIAGSFEEGTDGFRFKGLATTRMLCPPPIAELEAAFLKTLGAATSHRIIGDSMELLDASGALLLRIEATNLR